MMIEISDETAREATMSNEKWESVDVERDSLRPRDSRATKTHRLRVPGGWLYRVTVWYDGKCEGMWFSTTVVSP